MSVNTLAVRKWMGRARRKAPKDPLAHDLLQLDVPQILDRLFFHFLENVTIFAHELTSKVCSSLRFETLDASRQS